MATGVIWYKTQPDSEVALHIDQCFCDIFGKSSSHDVTAHPDKLAPIIKRLFARTNTIIIIYGAAAVQGNDNIISRLSYSLSIPLDKTSRSRYLCDTLRSIQLPSLAGSVLFPSRFGGPEGVLLRAGSQSILLIPSENNSSIVIAESMKAFLAARLNARLQASSRHSEDTYNKRQSAREPVAIPKAHSYSEADLRIRMEMAVSEMRELEGISDESYLDDFNRSETYDLEQSNRDNAYFYYKSKKRKIGNIVSVGCIVAAITLVLLIGSRLDVKTFASSSHSLDNSLSLNVSHSDKSRINETAAKVKKTSSTKKSTATTQNTSTSVQLELTSTTKKTTAKKTAAPTKQLPTNKASNSTTMRIRAYGEIKTGDAVEILASIVEAEMGSDYGIEALKAQAVAAYTYYLYSGGSEKAPSFPTKTPSSKSRSAAKAVLGTKMTYKGKIAYTPYYAISAGKTASNASINETAIAYLKSVDCSPDKNVKGYKTVHTYSSEQVAKKIKSSIGVDLTQIDKKNWFNVTKRDGNELYVEKISIGGRSYRGSKVWLSVLGYSYVRSACFYIQYNSDDDSFTFTSYGYGHGVGMSQTGANQYASQGKDYKWILQHFYSGVSIG